MAKEKSDSTSLIPAVVVPAALTALFIYAVRKKNERMRQIRELRLENPIRALAHEAEDRLILVNWSEDEKEKLNKELDAVFKLRSAAQQEQAV